MSVFSDAVETLRWRGHTVTIRDGVIRLNGRVKSMREIKRLGAPSFILDAPQEFHLAAAAERSRQMVLNLRRTMARA